MKASSNFGVGTLRKYTVVGTYIEGEESCCFHVEARDADDANVAARLVAGHNFRMAGVFSGYVYPLATDGSDAPKIKAEVLQ